MPHIHFYDRVFLWVSSAHFRLLRCGVFAPINRHPTVVHRKDARPEYAADHAVLMRPHENPIRVRHGLNGKAYILLSQDMIPKFQFAGSKLSLILAAPSLQSP